MTTALLSAICVLPAAILMHHLASPDSWHNLLVGGAVMTITMLTGMYLFILDDWDRRRLTAKIKGFILREKPIVQPESGEEIR